jgi:hypothetical protein
MNDRVPLVLRADCSGDDIVRSRAQLLVGNPEVDQDAAQVRDPAKRHLRSHRLTDALIGTDLRPARRREGQFEELKVDRSRR